MLAGLSANLDHGELPTGFREPEWNTVAGLQAWVLAAAQGLARDLDARNGNDMYARSINRALAATRVEKPLAESPVDALDVGTEATSAIEGSAEGTASVSTATPPTAPDSILAKAEGLAAQQAYGEAIPLYAEAAKLLESGGWLERSGLAFAEAAQCAALANEEETSHQFFTAAVSRLRTGGSNTGTLSAVLTAWAPIAARMNDPETLLRITQEELQRFEEFNAEGLSEDLAERRRSEWLLERATLRDTFARSLAAAAPEQRPSGFGLEQAAAEATSAGEEFAQLGRIADAAHAFWLAGKVQLENGQTTDALWSLESAFEGFSVAQRREERAHTASELIDLLRQTGQPERADEIVAQL
ncbi:hypothetical protein G7066_05955 [Leucobacter coleopterorum]|uniref:Tetratricopeptide repeat-containing protein n=1 Tax=Leucobacter coleopterorum TaxID=2714933 RepID=A0ABX6JZA9_9MICO|nr:hypothetical protein [Leucobacter coleopterorum]QIM18307.1 hypothetical protein G7066_05955 [Leucobacter coleopterorum]